MDPDARKQFGKAGVTPDERAQKSNHWAEKEMHNQYLGFLNRVGLKRYIHAPMTSRSPLPPGWPDFTVFGPIEKVLLLDFKTPNGVISDDQQIVWSALAVMGHVVHVLTSYEEATKLTEEYFDLL